MSFYPIQIEQVPGFGFTGGPEFQTNIQSIQSGGENRNGEWTIARHKFTAPFANISNDAYLAIKKVFLICRGRLHTFLYRDWADFTAINEPFGTGDGATKTFYLSKMSKDLDTGALYLRAVSKPNVTAPLDTPIALKVDGVVTAATVSDTDGSVVFASAPATGAALTWTGEFFVQVRFDMDYLPFSINDRNKSGYVTNGSVDLIEVLGE
jgi:uncharacterized protein (TIGR02217 family)